MKSLVAVTLMIHRSMSIHPRQYIYYWISQHFLQLWKTWSFSCLDPPETNTTCLFLSPNNGDNWHIYTCSKVNKFIHPKRTGITHGAVYHCDITVLICSVTLTVFIQMKITTFRLNLDIGMFFTSKAYCVWHTCWRTNQMIQNLLCFVSWYKPKPSIP